MDEIKKMKITMNNAFRVYDKKRAHQLKLHKAWKQACQVCNDKYAEQQKAHAALRIAARQTRLAYDIACRKRTFARRAWENANWACAKTRRAINILFPQEYKAWKKMTKGIKIPT
jgi:hypothetical protein